MRLIFKSIPYILIGLSYVLSLTLFSYILVGYIYHSFNPKEILVDHRLFEQEYTKTLLTDVFLLGFTGWLVSHIHRNSLLTSSKLTFTEKCLYIFTVFMTSSFYMQNIELPRIHYYILHLLLFCMFAGLYRLLLSFYIQTTIDFTEFLSKYRYAFMNGFLHELTHGQTDHKKYSKFHTTAVITSVFVTSITTVVIFYTGTKYIKGTIIKENRLKDQLYIQRIIPTKTTHAEKVVLKGYNFGWGSISDKRFALLSSDGPINQVEKWENTVIVFIVPLHLHVGKRQIWIQKPADQLNTQSIITQSNHVNIEVFSRFDFYPAHDDTILNKVYKKIRNFIFYNTIEDTATLLK